MCLRFTCSISALYMCACGLFVLFVFAYLSYLFFPSSFFMRLTFSSISSFVSYLPEYGPAPFPGHRQQEATEPGFSLFVLMFAVFLVEDACLFLFLLVLVLILRCDSCLPCCRRQGNNLNEPLDPFPFFWWLLNKKAARVEVNISLPSFTGYG